MNRLQQSRIFLIAAILLIVAFQSYWLNKLYKEERAGLEKEAGTIFRDVVYNLQVDRFKADTFFYKKNGGPNLFVYNAVNAIRHQTVGSGKEDDGIRIADSAKIKNGKVVFFGGNDSAIMNNPGFKAAFLGTRGALAQPNMDTELLKLMAKSGMKMSVRINEQKHDSAIRMQKDESEKISSSPISKTITFKRDSGSKSDMKAIIRMITDGKALDDTIAFVKIDSAYKKELTKSGITLHFSINKAKDDSTHWIKGSNGGSSFNTIPVSIGFIHPYWYRAEFESPAGYIIKRISPQILFSFFLVAFTSLAFIFLYRNLLAQRKLTAIKNDFISNVTHELKTPIATVNVAIEALRNFGGLDNPARTKEYLDISASELQRLGLLVDKVLKLSMFEKQEITLQKESFDFLQLIEEVIASMKLQFEKQKVAVSIETAGDNFMIDADKLHITSVVYNLLDNALKYSKEDPQINVKLIRHTEYFELRVSDNGIGIPVVYQSKIFEQFFRVPNGNRHNTKGYGLGLSYVNHIVKKHMGFIEVESEPGKGSTFIVKLPFAETDTIHFDKG